MKDFDINKIAELAMLELSEDEKAALQKDMAGIVAFAERISGAEEDIQEWSAQDISLREDMTGNSLTVGEALSSAPEKQEGFFYVPQVVE